jgi:hypothetical protein
MMTGIPPQATHMQRINDVKDVCEEIKIKVRGVWEDLKMIVHEALMRRFRQVVASILLSWTQGWVTWRRG